MDWDVRLGEAWRRATEAVFGDPNVKPLLRPHDLEPQRDGPRVDVGRREQDNRRPVLLGRERELTHDPVFPTAETLWKIDHHEIERTRARHLHDDTRKVLRRRPDDQEPREIDSSLRETWRVEGARPIDPGAPMLRVVHVNRAHGRSSDARGAGKYRMRAGDLDHRMRQALVRQDRLELRPIKRSYGYLQLPERARKPNAGGANRGHCGTGQSISSGVERQGSLEGREVLSMDAHQEQLLTLLQGMGSVLVCYSGGVDSALVLAAAHKVLGNRAIGMTAVSASLAPEEKELAIRVAKHIGARHELVESHEVDDPDYQRNGPDRCFHCKSELYDISSKQQKEWGALYVLNGTNIDDLGDHRPGLEAAKRAGVRSLLVEAGFHKPDVRRVAEAMGLPIWDKPASACLSSRIPYGTSVSRDKLAQIAALEAELHLLGLRQVRVRWHAVSSGTDASLARIEVDTSELGSAFERRAEIASAARRFGFNYVTLDLEGYRMGSHNEVLGSSASRRALRVL
jgi:uncharacterized protein